MESWSFPKATTCGNKADILSEDTILAKFDRCLTASIFTSIYESFNKLLYVWIRLISVTYFPKLQAMSVKFLDKQSLTLHDLSSAACMINGMIKVLF